MNANLQAGSPSLMNAGSAQVSPAHVGPPHVSPAHVSPAHVSPAHVSPVPIADLALDGSTQPRAALDAATVAEYAEALGAGAAFPPVVVYHDGAAWWLADGFHRVAAAQAAGQATVLAEVRPGDRRAALLHAVGANAVHGLRRSNADKRRAVLLLLEDPEWSHWSDREIARQCRVSPPLVSQMRQATAEADRPDTLSVNIYRYDHAVNAQPRGAEPDPQAGELPVAGQSATSNLQPSNLQPPTTPRTVTRGGTTYTMRPAPSGAGGLQVQRLQVAGSPPPRSNLQPSTLERATVASLEAALTTHLRYARLLPGETLAGLLAAMRPDAPTAQGRIDYDNLRRSIKGPFGESDLLQAIANVAARLAGDELKVGRLNVAGCSAEGTAAPDPEPGRSEAPPAANLQPSTFEPATRRQEIIATLLLATGRALRYLKALAARRADAGDTADAADAADLAETIGALEAARGVAEHG